MTLDIDANLSYSVENGCTAVNAPTVPDVPIRVIHTPTKQEPYTDVIVTFRIMGTVTIEA